MQEVILHSGFYKGQQLSDITCKLMKPIKYGARGWFGQFQVPGYDQIVRIQLPSEDSITVLDTQTTEDTDEQRTEEEIIESIKERFQIFEDSVNGVAEGAIRALIVAGAAGIGKSETILRTLEEQQRKHAIDFNLVKGNIVSAYQLYQVLFDNQSEDKILVLDDCDSILHDGNGLNILKSALESGSRPRKISYKSESVIRLGLPTEFVYEGNIIFITNLDFQKIIDLDKSKLAKHLAALVDRSLYLDLKLHSQREIYCRISYMVKEEDILDFSEIDKSKYDEILFWIKNNLSNVRSLSLRTAIHLAEMVKTNPDKWQRMASAFLLRQGR